ncbi:hypothetical protein JR316_0011196 [Psilocybe cubensis]|nr:hypothetical protein JR316_0011196 [Psilocybe cubensis]KAH9475641.1 hypothetical protein JR316_0011196 [Psilocybe cubensis]
MHAVARGHQGRDLKEFGKTTRTYHTSHTTPHNTTQHNTFQYHVTHPNPRTTPATTPPTELQSDPSIPTHLPELYEALLKGNIKRVVEPYSIVKIGYYAQ